MGVQQPSLETLARIADQYGFEIPADRLATFRALVGHSLASYARLDQLVEPSLPVSYPRRPGHRPAPEDNPLGAWYWKSEIRGATAGPLSGKKVAIKDNVCVAGVPMMNGTGVLEGYVPDVDATIVTRILDAGGTILGKAVCESLCFSGGSHTADSGPVRNPYDPSRSTGGSSSGSAALVAAGEVDLAIGGDQGGSVRIPSCWSGIYGLKPTWGLVPYTGAFPIEASLDHLGPMARSSRDVALLLSVQAAQAFGRLGAKVEEVSIPWHRDAMALWNAIVLEGATAIMVAGEGMAYGAKGRYATGLVDAYAQGRRQRGERLSDTVKLAVLA